MHPTKHQISLLYAHNFKLWDGSRQWQIESLHKEGISIVMDESDTLPNSITFEDIGKGFKVIRRPLSDLTVADGDGKVAIENLFESTFWFKTLPNDRFIKINQKGLFISFVNVAQERVEYNFRYSAAHGFVLSQIEPEYEHTNILTNQQQLFEKLYELGFFPSLADDCCVGVNGLNK